MPGCHTLVTTWLTALLLLLAVASLGACLAPLALQLDRMGVFHSTIDLADLDGDGDLDALLHNVRNEAEFIAFAATTRWDNDGRGRFVAERMEYLPGVPGWAAAAGDIDQDGDADLVTFTSRALRLAVNLGGAQDGENGDFAGGPSIQAPRRDDQFGSILLGDLTGDGRLDSAILGCCGRAFTLDPADDTPNYSWVWRNTMGAGGEPAPQVSIVPALDGLAVRAGALADLDNDGDLDLFVAVVAPPEGRNRDPSDRVLLNDGAGNFADSGQRLGAGDSDAVALGDVDGDGDVDALVGASGGATLWLNQGAGAIFARSAQGLPGDRVRVLFLTDMDGDGALDAVLGGMQGAGLWYNDGAGVFTLSTQRFAYSERHGLAVGDLNGDGRLDLFAAEYASDARVWINRGGRTFVR